MKKYRNEAMKVVHEQAAYFFSKGIITADEMKEYDEGCLVSKADASFVAAGINQGTNYEAYAKTPKRGSSIA